MLKNQSFDLDPEALLHYRGTNPKPADFEQYWNETMEEMESISPGLNIEYANLSIPGVRCAHLTFTGLGGARIYAKFLRPASAHPDGNPGLLSFHGYSGQSGDWSSYLNYVALGFFVVAMDCRGQAGISEDSGGIQRHTLKGHIVRGAYDDPKTLKFRSIFSDTARLARLLMDMPEVDAGRIVATGGSQGGGLAIACSALVPEISRATFFFPFLCDYKRVWELELAESGAYQEMGELVKRHDPRGEKLDLLFNNLGYVDAAHHAPNVKAKTFMATGLQDRVCPPSTQFAAYNRIAGEKSHQFYPLHQHEPLPGFQDRALQEWLPLLPRVAG